MGTKTKAELLAILVSLSLIAEADIESYDNLSNESLQKLIDNHEAAVSSASEASANNATKGLIDQQAHEDALKEKDDQAKELKKEFETSLKEKQDRVDELELELKEKSESEKELSLTDEQKRQVFEEYLENNADDIQNRIGEEVVKRRRADQSVSDIKVNIGKAISGLNELVKKAPING